MFSSSEEESLEWVKLIKWRMVRGCFESGTTTLTENDYYFKKS